MIQRLTVVASCLLILSNVAPLIAYASDRGVEISVSGNIASKLKGAHEITGENVAIVDLEKLPQTEIRTYTDWTDGLQVFSGVLLKDLIDAVGASGNEIVATALNDYSATIPISDAYDFSVLLAIKHNGSYMRVRDKGPIWIVYPSKASFTAKVNPYNDRMVWQLSQLEFR